MSAINPISVVGGEKDALFVAQYARPESLESFDFAALTPFQRALLTIDGTVTQFIESYTLESVRVICAHQEWRRLTSPHRWLDTRENERILFRQVVLRGAESRTLYALATSLIAFDRLPEAMREGVASSKESLGRLLRRHRVETHRELLWWGWGRPTEFADSEYRTDEKFLSRAYRMIARGKPIMLITENFPAQQHE